MKKLEEVAKVINGKSAKKTDKGIWIKAVEEFKVESNLDGINKDHYILVVPGKELLKEYLTYLLERPLKLLSKSESEKGKVVKRLTISSVKNIEIPDLPIDKQKKILQSKDVKKRIAKLWLDHGVRAYEEPLKVDMEFDELLRLMVKNKP